MYPTIIFAIALLLSIIFIYRTISGLKNNTVFRTENSDMIMILIIPIFWSWLFYLLY